MSGFKSSEHGDPRGASIEALSFTVHSQPAPELQGQRRTTVGRVKMLLVLLVCAAPVIASYLSYYVLRPEGRSNYGALILPTRSLPPLALRSLSGEAFDAMRLKGQWLLVVVGPSACSGDCEQRLYLQRQLREMLGRERERVDKLWLITDDQALPPPLWDAIRNAPAMTVLRADRAAVAAWLQPQSGQALEDHLYVVDPMGEWMMRMPARPEPSRVKRDLERLLRAAAGWDQPGR